MKLTLTFFSKNIDITSVLYRIYILGLNILSQFPEDDDLNALNLVSCIFAKGYFLIVYFVANFLIRKKHGKEQGISKTWRFTLKIIIIKYLPREPTSQKPFSVGPSCKAQVQKTKASNDLMNVTWKRTAEIKHYGY